MGRFGVGACGAVLVMVLAVAGCGAGAASGSVTPTLPTQAAVADEVTVQDAAARVDELGAGRFAAQYAGLEPAGGGLVVYRKPSAEFDAAIAALGLRVPVRVHDAPYTAKELRTLSDRITGELGYWHEHGVAIASVGPRHDGSAVEVGVPEPGDAARLLTARYGTSPPTVVVARGPVGLLTAESPDR